MQQQRQHQREQQYIGDRRETATTFHYPDIPTAVSGSVESYTPTEDTDISYAEL